MMLSPINQLNLYGHKDKFIELINLFKSNNLPNKLLLSGKKGIGKSTIAYHLINYILSINEKFSYDLKNFRIDANNKSFKLILNKSNPNFYLIDVEENKKNIDINQIRKLILDLNKSSFNQKPRFVLIDNIDCLNHNSINALLKILEEPNENINFILINNNKKILPTLKSRCLDFKISISYEETIQITKQILSIDIFEKVNNELINYYQTPGDIVRLIDFANNHDLDLRTLSLKDFLCKMIKDKYFIKSDSAKFITCSFIELYYRKKISIFDTKCLDYYKNFIKNINNVNQYNLDLEPVFIKFENENLND